MIDDPEAGVFRVDRRIFTDPGIAVEEQSRIFDRCWIYAGHESEIASPGDFRTRDVAGRPMILARDADGRVRVYLNTCRHMGGLVCRQPSGNAKTFQCPFHGWTYDNRGALVGVPGEDAYAALERAGLGLVSPRVESYRGFVFVNLDPAAVPLVEYLAGACEYLDYVCDQADGGFEIVTGTQLYHMRANWKFLYGNSMDGYHAFVTHRRYMEWLAEYFPDAMKLGQMKGLSTSRTIDLGNGHAVQMARPSLGGRPIALWNPVSARRESRRWKQRAASSRSVTEWSARR